MTSLDKLQPYMSKRQHVQTQHIGLCTSVAVAQHVQQDEKIIVWNSLNIPIHWFLNKALLWLIDSSVLNWWWLITMLMIYLLYWWFSPFSNIGIFCTLQVQLITLLNLALLLKYIDFSFLSHKCLKIISKPGIKYVVYVSPGPAVAPSQLLFY